MNSRNAQLRQCRQMVALQQIAHTAVKDRTLLLVTTTQAAGQIAQFQATKSPKKWC